MMKIISKTKWRVLSLLTALAMILPLMPMLPAQVTALAEETAAAYGAFTVVTEDGECSYRGSVLTISAGGEYTISQTAESLKRPPTL
ncbi:MAG: hypothetical protein LIO59_01155 [Oscillospiraceae bacterium]|nr:hypothetical protein [Oscillospiraceae bacterium]